MEEIKEKLIKKLKELGLSQNEAKAYIALIELDVASPLEIAQFSGIPISKVYYILSELERKGLVEIQQSRPKLYRALDPQRSLHILAEKYLKAKEEALRLIDMVSTSIRETKVKTFWIIKGRRNIIERIKSLIKNTKYSLATALTDQLLSSLSIEFSDAIKRGINVSLVIYKTKDPLTQAMINRFKRDAMVKVRDIIVPSVFLVDDKIGIIYLTKTLYRGVRKKTEVALLIEDEDFLPVFGTYYRFFIWYPSKLVTRPEEFFSKPRTYCIFYRAVEDASYLLSKNIELNAIAEGWHIANNKERIVLEGRIIDVYQSPEKTVYNMTLVTKNGEKYLLGGKRCIIEDIETEKITLIPSISSRK